MSKFYDSIDLKGNQLLNVDLSNVSLERLSSHPNTITTRIYYNTTDNKYYGYIDNIGWFPLTNTQWQPSVATYSDLDNVAEEDGMSITVRDEDVLYVYDAATTAWLPKTGSGSIENTVLNVTANTTLSLLNTTVFVDASGGDVTVTLPAASTSKGYLYKVCKTNLFNWVIVDTVSGNINDNATLTIIFKNSTVCLESDGTNYHIV